MSRKMRRAERRNFETRRDVIARRGGTRFEPAFTRESMLSLVSDALQHQQSGQTSQAVALYDRILSLKPDIAEVHCNRGVALVSLGRLEDAETAYRQAIALNPSFANAHNNLGVVLCEIGKPYDAELAFRAAIKLKPKAPQPHLHLGVALRRQSKFGDAEIAHRQAIALDPGCGDAYTSLGDVLRCLGKFDEAEKALRHAIGLRPQSADAFSKLGNTLRDQGKLGEAVSACRRAVALDPNNAGAYYQLGAALGNQGELIEAAAAYRRAIALNPKFAGAYNDLGIALKHLGRLTEARQAVEQAIHLAPQNALHFLNLGEVRSFSPGDPYLAAMEKAAENILLLPTRQQIELRFALAKAYEDVNRRNELIPATIGGERTPAEANPIRRNRNIGGVQAHPGGVHTRADAGLPEHRRAICLARFYYRDAPLGNDAYRADCSQPSASLRRRRTPKFWQRRRRHSGLAGASETRPIIFGS